MGNLTPDPTNPALPGLPQLVDFSATLIDISGAIWFVIDYSNRIELDTAGTQV